MNVLAINLVLMTVVFAIAAQIYVFPRLASVDMKTVLVPILLLHATRHLGLMFLSPGATNGGIPREFACPAAFGDLIAAVLALFALVTIMGGYAFSRVVVWIFNVWGTVDLLAAIILANLYDVESYMGPAFWIPAVWVPALLVTHYIVFLLLIKKRTGEPGV